MPGTLELRETVEFLRGRMFDEPSAGALQSAASVPLRKQLVAQQTGLRGSPSAKSISLCPDLLRPIGWVGKRLSKTRAHRLRTFRLDRSG